MTAERNQPQANAASVVAYFDAINAGDLARAASFLADDLVWELPYDAETSPIAGKYDLRGLMTLFDNVAQMIPAGLKFKLGTMTAQEDRVAVEASSHADTPYGPFRNRYHFLLRFRDGKIVEAKEYADSAMLFDFVRRVQAAAQGPSTPTA